MASASGAMAKHEQILVLDPPSDLKFKERAIARHEVREIEQRHTMDGPRQDATLDEEEDIIIIYNRVPKTASTSFTNIAYDLCAKNRYHVLHINTTKNNPVMSLQDQVRFVKNITTWNEMKPGFYHGHISYLDFAKKVQKTAEYTVFKHSVAPLGALASLKSNQKIG